MSRLFRIVLVLTLPVVAVAALLLSNDQSGPRQPMDSAVAQYVYSFQGGGVTIGQYVEAKMPQNFRPEMSKVSFGNGSYYQTSYQYESFRSDVTETPYRPVTAPIASTPGLRQNYASGGMPLPYPPNDLWCVQLNSADAKVPKVVMLALHQDIYNAEWVLHEVTDPAVVMPAVGCAFSTQ